MEQLLKDLKELGYSLYFYEPLECWRVVDYIAGIDDYLPCAFSQTVFKHGFIFSFGITLDGKGLCVEFSEL